MAWLSLYLSVLVRHPLEGLAIAWWWLARRRLRALGRLRAAAAGLPQVYRWWSVLHRSSFEDPWPPGLPAPHIIIHLHLASGHDAEAARRACLSVFRQSYTAWTLIVTTQDGTPILPHHAGLHIAPGTFPTRAAALRHVLATASCEYIVPIDSSIQLTRGALHAYAATISDMSPAASRSIHPVVYADQDELDEHGNQTNPWLKPEWNPEMFVAQDYLSAACALPRQAAWSTLERAPSLDETPDDGIVSCLLAYMLIGQNAPSPVHIDYIAATTADRAWQILPPGRMEAIRRLLPDASMKRGPFGTLDCTHPVPPFAPKVSIIVPTRDRIDLLRPCIDSVLRLTDYPDYELIIVDNGSRENETLAYFDQASGDLRVRVLRWPYAYNYSAINNFAVAQASGQYICLLNNDTEVIAPQWLSVMMSHAIGQDIGAVGARLLYADRSIQHAGVVIGMGGAAGHAHRGIPEDDPGYFAQSLIARQATAVTAACLVVSKAKFESVGGLDERDLAIAYNDIDLCLKLRGQGLRNIYEPRALLYHYESKSRGLDFAPEHLARYLRELGVFQQRWSTVGFRDPTHHRMLDPASETYRLKV
ncbi:glycosyltransferase family 2 protein [Novosphingobium sp. ERN07]|uniref:glycosyltransferase family 2 protein n=1 Tax=Novosphingobium sp. ERN07 TaxID=2726187 RepID=UPI0014576E8E|nr:glycosyltransferase family 2 protein [Novosphingobium sp. ERN07]